MSIGKSTIISLCEITVVTCGYCNYLLVSFFASTTITPVKITLKQSDSFMFEAKNTICIFKMSRKSTLRAQFGMVMTIMLSTCAGYIYTKSNRPFVIIYLSPKIQSFHDDSFNFKKKYKNIIIMATGCILGPVRRWQT